MNSIPPKQGFHWIKYAPAEMISVFEYGFPCPTCGGDAHDKWKPIYVDLDHVGKLEGIRVQCQVCGCVISLHGRQSARYRKFLELAYGQR